MKKLIAICVSLYNGFAAWINKHGSKLPYVGPYGFLLIVLILGLALLVYLPWVLGLVLITLALYWVFANAV